MTDTNTAAALSAEADGWIEWHGGENPVPGRRVDVRCRNGLVMEGCADVSWSHPAFAEQLGSGPPSPGDIIAYRVSTPAPAALEGSSLGEGEASRFYAVKAAIARAMVDERGCIIEAGCQERGHDDPSYAASGFIWQATEAAIIAALQPSSAADAKPVAGPPREPTETMMDALLYHSSADTEWQDAYTMWTQAHDTWFRDGDALGPAAQPHPSQQAGADGVMVDRELLDKAAFALSGTVLGPQLFAALKPVEG